ncbi:uncharacterized protein LOC111404536 [Olea europaea var. sylvestris]|uniref:uncharacterized protein LOC111404536 n=1 Tax=Olea europaea var. sylvestris TaxID=158386 RepID=UPI000C1CD8D1|nr:uncharacterized protein LOC111404536 [Olea europaea var. sylvestris]
MISFGSFIYSHPLYFSYLIFLSPYLLKLISFLSPLFITTFLLFLSLLTLIPSFYKKFAIDQSSSKDDDEHEEFQCMEDLEVYKIVFGESEFEVKGILLDEKSEVNSNHEDSSSISKSEALIGNLEENSVRTDLDEKVEEKKIVLEGKKVDPTSGTKAEEFVDMETEISLTRNGSKATDNGEEHTWKIKSSEKFSSQNLGSYGSMRKEKEWKRTLACKLFEERRNVDGSEGMDSLWETYEMDSDKSKLKNDAKKKINIKSKNKKSVIDVQENENEEEIDGKLCCLQALKFSAGKMNLGIGRPNVVRNISKAIKGIGWLHTVNRQVKKVHHNGDRY